MEDSEAFVMSTPHVYIRSLVTAYTHTVMRMFNVSLLTEHPDMAVGGPLRFATPTMIPF